jgi:O-acetyl-ADP-ribose deacetylase (regulator of RNase III)
MIHYLNGDATEPVGDGNKVIAHVCNDVGGWGAGFVVAISNKWLKPESSYRKWHKGNLTASESVILPEPFALGNLQLIRVVSSRFDEINPSKKIDGIWIANMIAQTGYGSNQPPIRYEAIESCLNKLNDYLVKLNATMHSPRFGCGLAGGKWSEIEKLIQKCITVDVYIYDYNKDDAIPWNE